MIEIPIERLSAELLEAVITEFVLREGTDYGVNELSLEAKIADVRRQIDRGKVVVVYDSETESCNLLTRHQLSELKPQ